MEKISIVTYLRASETITQSFLLFVQQIQNREILDNVYIFTVTPREVIAHKNWIIIYDNGKTKYERLRYLINTLQDSILFSIDNDMTIDFSVFETFLNQFIFSDRVIGWGKIGVSNKGFVPSLISVDKNLSHYFIRPLLWKLNIGISIPGQCFILRTKKYFQRLPETNTFLDDLQIGLFTCYQGYQVFQSEKIIGTEKVQDTLGKLFRQRKRWAKGFASTLKTAQSMNRKFFILVLLHGFSYHLTLPIFIPFLLSLYFVNSIIAFTITFLLLILLCKGNFSLLGSALLYCMIFPWLHLYWLISLIPSRLETKHVNQ